MLITTIVISVAASAGATGFGASRLRKRAARRKAENAARAAEAASGRSAYPTAPEYMKSQGFELLDGKPRPVPQLHGKIALRSTSTDCEFTHEEIKAARQDYPVTRLLELAQVVADGSRNEYRQIGRVCNACLHFYPSANVNLAGTSFEGRVEGWQSLRDVVSDPDRHQMLEERRVWLEKELGDVELKLLKMAHESPARLANHPHRGHPRLLASGEE